MIKREEIDKAIDEVCTLLNMKSEDFTITEGDGVSIRFKFAGRPREVTLSSGISDVSVLKSYIFYEIANVCDWIITQIGRNR